MTKVVLRKLPDYCIDLEGKSSSDHYPGSSRLNRAVLLAVDVAMKYQRCREIEKLRSPGHMGVGAKSVLEKSRTTAWQSGV